MLYPLTFQPIFKERVWGGRNLERLYGKPLPPERPIGESWEISDRPGDVSVITNGPLAGKDLRWLMTHHAAELLGPARAWQGRFPLLIKILDARETLSLQVHPPAAQAGRLGGDPKTELWHITDAAPGAELFVGLKNGVTRATFEQRLQDGRVAECFHRVPVRAGDTMFLPSGRVHALGAGLVLFEIQQNSDTTYRVFDWGRVGLDGQPRALHIAESLASIDFADFEPGLVQSAWGSDAGRAHRILVRDPLFTVEEERLADGARLTLPPGVMHLIACVAGRLDLTGEGVTATLRAGQFSLVPAAVREAVLIARSDTRFLRVEAGATAD
ncbi:MAG TPA: class I mannose-6-phosphate isomerase [Verrucomicrobiota bacterium]|nr:class I mannose-6-phosphate isomerase [Verrucomicrobiota bacterium]HQB16534.1 class I mannose-6-phosphate isomerase [Verrucomicrobiota bacterium]